MTLKNQRQLFARVDALEQHNKELARAERARSERARSERAQRRADQILEGLEQRVDAAEKSLERHEAAVRATNAGR